MKQLRTITVPRKLPQPPGQVKKRRVQEASSKNVITIPMGKLKEPPLPANTRTIKVVDMKETRREILSNWRGFTSMQIVQLHRMHYTNLRSAAVMLSRLKQELGQQDDPPNEEYLSKLALAKKEYNEIRQMNKDVRKRGAMDVVTVSNADSIVLQALQYVTSSDPNLLFASLCPLTGLRPIEIAKMALFQTKLNNKQEHQSWWACQTRFAKRGTMKSKYNECRNRPFLAPYWLIERALHLVRKRWPCKDLTNKEISRKYSTHWHKILVKAFPQLPGITARLCRRFFAVYSHHFFGKSVFVGGESQASLNGYASWVLGHATLEDQVIAYSSLVIRPMPKLNLFEAGKNLKVSEPAATTNPNTSAVSSTDHPVAEQTGQMSVPTRIDEHNSTKHGA